MDEHSILEAQIQALSQELDLLRETIPHIGPYLPIYPDRGESVAQALENFVDEQQYALHQVERDVEKDKWKWRMGDQEGRLLEACWRKLYDINQQSRPLFQECLALLEGVLVRQEGIDRGLCTIADHLLDELSNKLPLRWERFTVLDEAEYFGHMAQIIRLRFPEASVWNLPVAGHEFGHFVASQWRTVHSILEDEMRLRGPKYRNYAEEQFADAFATYALGPAYACTCIILRFDPVAAYQEGYSHPSFAKRVHWILKVLQMMDAPLTEELHNLWQQSVLATKQKVFDPSLVELDDLLHRWYSELERRSTSRYVDFDHAFTLLPDLIPSKEITALGRWHTLADVLNAAWLFRMGYADSYEDQDRHPPAQISDKALELCKQLIQRRDREARWDPRGTGPAPPFRGRLSE